MTPGFALVNPSELGAPRGFAHGLVAPDGRRLLFVAGQIAADPDGHVVSEDFTSQFDRALERVLSVVRCAGGEPQHIARMAVYVTNVDVYRRSRPALTAVWRRHMGRHYPAMTLVGVAALADAGAMVEIDATAVLP